MKKKTIGEITKKKDFAPWVSAAVIVFVLMLILYLYFTQDLKTVLILGGAVSGIALISIAVVFFATAQMRALLKDVATILYDKAIALEEANKEEEEMGDIMIKSDYEFKDVAGLERAKSEIRRYIVHPINKPELYRRYKRAKGAGVMLYGPPGCGKTLLGLAAASEAGVGFIHIKISDIMSKWFGQSEKNIRTVFQKARENAPCIVFIDEIDALGLKRGESEWSGRRILNQLLMEMDEINRREENILVMAATNAPWDIDPALRRTGRFSKAIFIPPPDKGTRAKIFKIHLDYRPVSDIDYKQLAELTRGYSASDIAQVCEDAADRPLDEAIRTGKERPISQQDVKQAIEQRKATLEPWIYEASKMLKRSGEWGIFHELTAYLDNKDVRKSEKE